MRFTTVPVSYFCLLSFLELTSVLSYKSQRLYWLSWKIISSYLFCHLRHLILKMLQSWNWRNFKSLWPFDRTILLLRVTQFTSTRVKMAAPMSVTLNNLCDKTLSYEDLILHLRRVNDTQIRNVCLHVVYFGICLWWLGQLSMSWLESLSVYRGLA
jgi:hypothetical protein